jgi:hypothetical protein
MTIAKHVHPNLRAEESDVFNNACQIQRAYTTARALAIGILFYAAAAPVNRL